MQDKTFHSNEQITFDSSIPNKRRITKDGYYKVKANLSKVGDVKYYPHEFDNVPNSKKDKEYLIIRRTEEELFKPTVLQSAIEAPVMLNHEPNLLNPENFKEYVVGRALDAKRNGDFLFTSGILIQDQDAIDAVVKEGINQISLGCTQNIKWVENKDYDGEFVNIHINQISIVPQGRLGSEVALFDSKPIQKGFFSMDDKVNLLEQVVGLLKGKSKATKSMDSDPDDKDKEEKTNDSEINVSKKDDDANKKEEPSQDSEPNMEALRVLIQEEIKPLADTLLKIAEKIGTLVPAETSTDDDPDEENKDREDKSMDSTLGGTYKGSSAFANYVNKLNKKGQ